jgi:hypothetical protein
MTAKKTTTDTTPDTTATDQPAGVVTSRNDNASDPTGVNPAATPETSTTPTLDVVDPVTDFAEVRYPIQCLAPMPCTCPKCIGVGTDENTLNAEEAKDAAEALLPTQTDEEAAAGAKDAADNKADADKKDDKPAK